MEKILREALKKEEKIVIEEVIKSTSMKYIGSTNIELYVFTTKNFAEKIINKNILNIKEAVRKIDEKIVSDVYLNNKKIKIDAEIELTSKKTAVKIDLDSLRKEGTNETSGENDIIEEIFKYENSILNKKRIKISLYNKHLNKEFSKEINMNFFKNPLFKLSKRKLINQLNELLYLKYEPNNNDTKEFIEIMHIK